MEYRPACCASAARVTPCVAWVGTMGEHRAWAVPLGLLVIALTAVATVAGHVGVGVSGKPLIATVGLAVFCAAALVFLLRKLSTRLLVALLLVMAAAVTLVHFADPDGPVIGLYLVVAYSPLRLPARTAGRVAGIAVLAFDVGILLDSADAVVFTLVVTGGAAFFFLFGLLLVREATQRARVDELLVALQASRTAELETAALAERARVAREMHDVLAHTLSGVALLLQGLVQAAARQQVEADFRTRLDRAAELAREGHAEARAAVSTLRGGPLPGPDQIQSLVEAHRAANDRPGTVVSFLEMGQRTALDAEAGLALYRTAQEALSNVRKHAPGSTVDVQLTWEPGRVCLTVDSSRPAGAVATRPDTDQTPRPGHGLAGISERAALLHGTTDSGPTPSGFRASITLPTAATTTSYDGERTPAITGGTR